MPASDTGALSGMCALESVQEARGAVKRQISAKRRERYGAAVQGERRCIRVVRVMPPL